MHNGILDTEKIFEKIELMISMARLTPNLVNASQKSEKTQAKASDLNLLPYRVWVQIPSISRLFFSFFHFILLAITKLKV